jgi:hypothetical protein
MCMYMSYLEDSVSPLQFNEVFYCEKAEKIQVCMAHPKVNFYKSDCTKQCCIWLVTVKVETTLFISKEQLIISVTRR